MTAHGWTTLSGRYLQTESEPVQAHPDCDNLLSDQLARLARLPLHFRAVRACLPSASRSIFALTSVSGWLNRAEGLAE